MVLIIVAVTVAVIVSGATVRVAVCEGHFQAVSMKDRSHPGIRKKFHLIINCWKISYLGREIPL